MLKFNNQEIDNIYMPLTYDNVESIQLINYQNRTKISKLNEKYIAYRVEHSSTVGNDTAFSIKVNLRLKKNKTYKLLFDINAEQFNKMYYCKINWGICVKQGDVVLATYPSQLLNDVRTIELDFTTMNDDVVTLEVGFDEPDMVGNEYIDFYNFRFKIDRVIYNNQQVFPNAPTPATLLSYPHSIGNLSRMTQTDTMTFDTYNISANPVRFTQNDEDDRAGSVIVNFQSVTSSGTLTSAKLYLYGKGSGSGFLEVDVGNLYVGDFRLDTTSQERIITLPTSINTNEPIKLTLDEEFGYYVDINAMKLELNYDGGRMLMGVKKTTKVQESSYHRYEKLVKEVE